MVVFSYIFLLRNFSAFALTCSSSEVLSNERQSRSLHFIFLVLIEIGYGPCESLSDRVSTVNWDLDGRARRLWPAPRRRLQSPSNLSPLRRLPAPLPSPRLPRSARPVRIPPDSVTSSRFSRIRTLHSRYVGFAKDVAAESPLSVLRSSVGVSIRRPRLDSHWALLIKNDRPTINCCSRTGPYFFTPYHRLTT